MKDLFEAARRLQGFLDSKKWRSCIIGGLAVQRWGEPRLTLDVDVTLLSGFGNEEEYIDELLKHFDSRVPDSREFALKRRVMLLRAGDGTDLDLALGGLPFEERVVERASSFEFYADIIIRTCSAEDLIVMKAFAERDRDWADVEGIIARQGTSLDWRLIMSELEPLCELKESPDIIRKLGDLRKPG